MEQEPRTTAGTERDHRPRRRFILTAIPLTAVGNGVAHADAATAGRVEEVKGQVTAELASRRRVLVPRADVFNGDDVATGDASRAAMLLGRDTTLRLGANAQIRIDRFIINQGGVLTLEGGPLLLDKVPGNPAAALKVRGSFGLITVRGTRIFVGPSQGVIGIFVVHGLIDVAAGGKEFVLQTGEGTNIAGPGAVPTPPSVWGEARIRAALASVN
jgi:ferric-dicitrate binding protein FerR (iron transport regulator)